jgi:predicted lipoprotein
MGRFFSAPYKTLFMSRLLILCTSFLFLMSCGGGDSNDNTPPSFSDDFDRVQCLSNIYDNIAILSFQEFQLKLDDLDESSSYFIENSSDITALNSLRSSWLDAYLVWQHIEVFSHFGKGEDILYGFKMNTYPTDVNRTKNIINGIAQFNPAFLDNQGFPALEYLIYGIENSDEEIINTLNSSTSLNLIGDIVSEMISNTSEVYNWWLKNRSMIVNDNSSTATSSLNLLINDFIYHYEKGFRTNKFGIPAGYFSGGQTFPEKTEGYYAGNISKSLALSSLESINNVFEGRKYGDNTVFGESMYTYLNFLQEGPLADEILIKLENIDISINNLDNDFAVQIETNNDEILNTFNLIQSVVAKFKIDMTMAMGVGIDYISGDGD